MADTVIGFLNRDACNYKQWTWIGVRGTFTAQERRDILNSLDDVIFFIPEQVGWPAVRIEPCREDGTAWCELEADGFFSVPDLASGPLPNFVTDQTPAQIAKAFLQAKREGWDLLKYGLDSGTCLPEEKSGGKGPCGSLS